MADAGPAADTKLKVFISYSRKDENFAQELLAGLQLAGFEPYLDKHDIGAGEDWEARLGRLIESADTVVFVISPDAVASERCAWEVERTVTLKKRLLPIVWRRVEEAQVPPRLKQLNYIFFDQPLMSVPSLKALSAALRTDLGWIREHTRLAEAAFRWDRRARNEALLFRGDELTAAKTWLADPPQYAPEPTLLHHEFIKAGEDAEAARSMAERQQLDQIAAAQEEREKALDNLAAALRRGRRALVAAAALLLCLTAGLIARVYERELYGVWFQYAKVRPYVVTAQAALAMRRPKPFWDCIKTHSNYSENCPAMVVVPGGEFIMGSPENEDGRFIGEEPLHKVTIKAPFAVSIQEITFDQWDACVAANGCMTIASDSGWQRGQRPVINVNWNDVKSYAAWLSKVTGQQYRLLTEAEWEYAARAGHQGRWSFGDDIGQLDEYAWLFHNAGGQTQPVGNKKSNAFGLYDMNGNVWEWVQDCHAENYKAAPMDGSAAPDVKDCGRVSRGGGFHDDPRLLRSANRYGNRPDLRSSDLGFRLTRTLLPDR